MSAEDLAVEVKSRRAELGIKQHELAEHGGPSLGTLRNIERGANSTYAATTLSALDRSLGWVAGSADQALKTGFAPVLPPEDPRKAAEARAMRIGYAVLALLQELES